MYIPSDPKMKDLLASYGLEGITYKNGVPDFSAFSYGMVDIFNMHGGQNGREINFATAFNEFSAQTGLSVSEIKEIVKVNNLTWHEHNNMTTMQLIPTKINGYFGHLGGEVKLIFILNFLDFNYL